MQVICQQPQVQDMVDMEWFYHHHHLFLELLLPPLQQRLRLQLPWFVQEMSVVCLQHHR
jgi:hypothetical protein